MATVEYSGAEIKEAVMEYLYAQGESWREDAHLESLLGSANRAKIDTLLWGAGRIDAIVSSIGHMTLEHEAEDEFPHSEAEHDYAADVTLSEEVGLEPNSGLVEVSELSSSEDGFFFDASLSTSVTANDVPIEDESSDETEPTKRKTRKSTK